LLRRDESALDTRSALLIVAELRIHLAPMLLGGGTPLFKPGTRQMYRQRDIPPSNNAVHFAYERA
jgi:hypothetical protein